MRKNTYFAIFEPSTDGSFGIYFPDLLGCVSYGEDFAHAQEMAKEALGLHIYQMEKDNDDIPAPTADPSKLDIDPETATGFIVSAISVFPDLIKNQLDNRAVKTNITLPAWLKEAAEAQNVNFSQIMQTSLKEYLGIAQ